MKYRSGSTGGSLRRQPHDSPAGPNPPRRNRAAFSIYSPRDRKKSTGKTAWPGTSTPATASLVPPIPGSGRIVPATNSIHLFSYGYNTNVRRWLLSRRADAAVWREALAGRAGMVPERSEGERGRERSGDLLAGQIDRVSRRAAVAARRRPRPTSASTTTLMGLSRGHGYLTYHA